MVSQAWFQQEREKAAQWAHDLLQRGFVILDGETTGLDIDDEFVQIGVIDSTGGVLMDTLVKPVKAISAEAANVHGITAEMVDNAPGFPDLYPRLCAILANQQVVAYNEEFDYRILHQTCERYTLDPIPGPPWQCAMKQYARYHGDWNPRYNSFKWVRLTNACTIEDIQVQEAHTATGDCLMTLQLMQSMAESMEQKS